MAREGEEAVREVGVLSSEAESESAAQSLLEFGDSPQIGSKGLHLSRPGLEPRC